MNPKDVLDSIEQKAKKRFGQNFLRDPKVLSDIIAAANLTETDTVVEIGPGLGVLTNELAPRVKRVIAIEADRDLAEYVRDHTAKNVTVITGDALQTDWALEIEGEYKIVANIPYSITSPLLRKIFSIPKKPSQVILMVQKELAERITAEPGSSDRGWLTLLCEASAETKIIRRVQPGSLYPAPKVDSAGLSLTPVAESKMPDIFWPAVEAGFRHKRQTLANSLKDIQVTKEKSEKLLAEMGLNPMIRPQELTFEQWSELSAKIQQK